MDVASRVGEGVQAGFVGVVSLDRQMCASWICGHSELGAGGLVIRKW